jgi:ribosome-associated protein
MRGRDEETGEFLAPSRSQRKRDADAILELAERLVALTPSQLARVPLPDSLVVAVADTRRINSNVAHKRQLHYLAKLMRREDDETLDPIRRSLEHDSAEARRETALLHRLEALRERLLAEGDSAFGELVDAHPELDRQQLRQLIRAAREERVSNRPPHAFREIFKVLKALPAAEHGE